ncbi:MAG: conjugal transfer protein TraB [Treponema sp. CETP13]|nr:MAG: conjugal transfer protein TraB [Treponema sp. CETP13]
MSQTEKRLELNGREIILIGTAHISNESINEATASIRNEKPDCVAIELDEQRLKSMQDPDSWKNLDIIKVLKEGQGFLMMANLVLSSFQKRMGVDVGVKPGDEMKSSIAVANELKIPAVMVDRPIKVTLQRAWAKNSFLGKCKLLALLFSSAFEKEEISSDQIENLKSSNEMDTMMNELADYLPGVKTVLIDERDQYLASHIWKCEGNKVVAVLGAGHLPGVERWINEIATEKKSSNTTEIESVPPKGVGSKIFGAAFPIIIIGLIVAGFFTGGAQMSLNMIWHWLLWNGSLAALGCIIALGNPLTIISGFLGAPLGTLNPFIAVGLFTGIVQAWVKKPKVSDMEHLVEDAGSLKGIYHNRITHVLLVFLLSSIGGAIGNIIAVPSLVSALFA